MIHHGGRGKADTAELNHSPSHHCQGVGGCVTAERNQSLSLNKTKAKIGQNIKVEKKSYSRLIKSLPDRVLFKVINGGNYGERALASRLLMNRGGLWARRLGVAAKACTYFS